MQRARLAPLALAAVASLALGCGGASYSSAFDGPTSADGGPLDDAGLLPDGAPPFDASHADAGSPWSPACPDALPATGTPCVDENLQCEYGDASWSVSCDQVVQCQNGQWWSYQPSYEPCSAAPGPNPSSCPASFASVPQGAKCSTTGLSCNYTQGSCSCDFEFEGPIELDAGSGFWGCLPENGCPSPRPRLGSACADEGTSCTYEACSYAQTCQGGVWQGQPEACAAE